MSEHEELRKIKEEQEERLDIMKNKNKELMDRKEQIISDNMKISDEILLKDNMIDQIKDEAKQKERQKKDLETETTKLREDIDEQKKIVKTKHDEYIKVKE